MKAHNFQKLLTIDYLKILCLLGLHSWGSKNRIQWWGKSRFMIQVRIRGPFLWWKISPRLLLQHKDKRIGVEILPGTPPWWQSRLLWTTWWWIVRPTMTSSAPQLHQPSLLMSKTTKESSRCRRLRGRDGSKSWLNSTKLKIGIERPKNIRIGKTT